jgi:peptidoglycan/LPS O-acetylase OafA/YrhL
MLLTMWIVSFHCVQRLGYFYYTNRAYAHFGFYGVEVFFILSGFILTYVNFSRFNSNSVSEFGVAYFKFMANRFFRIWPLHALVTFFWFMTDASCTWDWALKDITFADAIYTDTNNVCNAPSWFLHYEMYVCAFLPIFLFCLNKWRVTIAGIFALSVGLLYFYLNSVYNKWGIYALGSFIRGMAYFSTGIWAGYFFLRWPVQHPVFDILAGVALYFWQVQWMGPNDDVPVFFYKAAILTVVIVYCFSKGKVFNYFADNPAVAYVAEWSFAIYLIHWAVYNHMKEFLRTLNPTESASNFIMFAAVLYMSTLPLAIMAFYIVEEKVRNLARALLEGSRTPKAVTTPSSSERAEGTTPQTNKSGLSIQMNDVKLV